MRKKSFSQVFFCLLTLTLITQWYQPAASADSTGQGLSGGGQSPIDIPKSVLKIRKLPHLSPMYHSGEMLDEVCVEIKNGEKVFTTPPGLEAIPQVTAKITPRNNNFLGVGERIYEPVSFHWHTPSEHFVSGQQTAMELHIVHQEVFFNESDFTSGRTPETLIVAVLYVEGEKNLEIESIFSQLGRFQQQQCVDAGSFDLEALLPPRNSRTTYRYLGSSTESDDQGVFQGGVLWVVFTEPLTASVEQIFNHRDLVEGPLGNLAFIDAKTAARQKPSVGNTRPIQGLVGRALLTDLWPRPAQ